MAKQQRQIQEKVNKENKAVKKIKPQVVQAVHKIKTETIIKNNPIKPFASMVFNKVPKNKIKLVSIIGNIGSGKTTLAQMLSKYYRWIPQFEEDESNPYLVDFYQDMSTWSFNVQIHFLAQRLKRLLEIGKGNNATFIQDRTIYEDFSVFASCLKELNLLNERDFNTYKELFETISKLVTPPNLVIYLKASVPTLVEQIQNRGREYEENIRLDYLKRLNNHYENWVKTYKSSPVLVIDIDNNKFGNIPAHFKNIIDEINIMLKIDAT